MKRILFASLLFGSIAAFVVNAEAFCVHNNTTDREVIFDQTSGGETFGKYFGILKPGERGCCNWQNKDCNTAGKQDSPVKFSVRTTYSEYICSGYQITAGGDIYATGSNGNYSCSGQ